VCRLQTLHVTSHERTRSFVDHNHCASWHTSVHAHVSTATTARHVLNRYCETDGECSGLRDTFNNCDGLDIFYKVLANAPWVCMRARACVCLCVCVCVCVCRTHARTHAQQASKCARTHAHTHTRTHASTHAHTHARMHARTLVQTHTNLLIHT
jgi:hypothetical protein